MEGHGLSHEEWQSLDAIEVALRAQAGTLDRRLRTMEAPPRLKLVAAARRGRRAAAVLTLTAASILLGVGIATQTTAIVWVFCGVWTLALVLLLRRPRCVGSTSEPPRN